MSALGSGRVVRRSRTQKLDVLPAKLRGESGGTAPGAFAKEISVLLLERLLSNLGTKVSKPSTE